MNWKQHLLLGLFVIGICFLAGNVRRLEQERTRCYQHHTESQVIYCTGKKGEADYTWVYVDTEGKQHYVKVKRATRSR
jgi:hypothetical protein